jgi:hypothetical protein
MSPGGDFFLYRMRTFFARLRGAQFNDEQTREVNVESFGEGPNMVTDPVGAIMV